MNHLYTQREVDDARLKAFLTGLMFGALSVAAAIWIASCVRGEAAPEPRVHLRAPAPELRPDAGAPVRRTRALGEVWREGGADYVRM